MQAVQAHRRRPDLAPGAAALLRRLVGPGRVTRSIARDGYRLDVVVDPNRAAVPNDFSVRLTRAGKPVRGAVVTTKFAMLDMAMAEQGYQLRETSPGVYTRTAPALVMVGHWGITIHVEPPGEKPFDIVLVDRANG